MIYNSGKVPSTDGLYGILGKAYYVAQVCNSDFEEDDFIDFIILRKRHAAVTVAVAINYRDFLEEDNVSLSYNVFFTSHTVDAVHTMVTEERYENECPFPYGISFQWKNDNYNILQDKYVFVSHKRISKGLLKGAHLHNENVELFPYETCKEQLEQVNFLLDDFGNFLRWSHDLGSNDPYFTYVIYDVNPLRVPQQKIDYSRKNDPVMKLKHNLWLLRAGIPVADRRQYRQLNNIF